VDTAKEMLSCAEPFKPGWKNFRLAYGKHRTPRLI